MEEFEREERVRVLPNPHAEREMIIEECDGCNKIYSNGIESFCIAYTDPKIIQRKGCVLQSNKVIAEEIKKKKINPIKASKRGIR